MYNFIFSLAALIAGLTINTLVIVVDSQSPTFAPTNIPTPIVLADDESVPIALHQLVVVETANYAVIRLRSFSQRKVYSNYYIDSLPASGTLYQLSQVFSSYGYEPKIGTKVTTNETLVTGSNNRIIYQRPNPDYADSGKWGEFRYYVAGHDVTRSYEGTVTLVPPSGILVGSSFLLSNEDWTIVGNKKEMYATYENYSRGKLLNRYILGVEDKIDVVTSGASDSSLWYFQAPSKFYGNNGIAYGGTLSFKIGSFSGDFSKLNDDETNVVELICEECTGPVSKGITLGFSISAMNNSPNGKYSGDSKLISIHLLESSGWLKDSQNSLLPWTKPTQCDMIQVLSRLSKIKILGDWTTWYESVAIDDVLITNLKAQLPLCGMQRPDASVCTC